MINDLLTMKNISILFILLLLLTNCKKDLSANEIIDLAIISSGTNKLENAILEFDFRDKHYEAKRNSGLFSLKRIFKEGSLLIDDVISNDGFVRKINRKVVSIPDSMALKYSESVNSVHYFSVLPFGLNDKAVIKKKLPEVSIKGKEYHKIQITFQQEGGGVDYEDVFIYWFEKETFKLDYLAYKFHTNGGGMRFRKAVNERFINSIRFVDYINYSSDSIDNIKDFDKKFINNDLKKVSEIINENITLNFNI